MKRLVSLVLLAVAFPASAAPDFVPSSQAAFDGFFALKEPRSEVPVGALWIEHFGPYGEGAQESNLKVVRSLSGVTIDRNLQIALTAGLLDLFSIEPRFRNQFIARFGELEIVEVKDVSVLAGPPGEPRIVAALRAKTVTVSTNGEAGINGRTGWELRKVEGAINSGRSRANAIEGKDLFIAIRVATHKIVQSKEKELDFDDDSLPQTARIDDYEVRVEREGCPEGGPADCLPSVQLGVVKLSTHESGEPEQMQQVNEDGLATLKLPVPIADGEEGLYTEISLRWVRPCDILEKKDCRSRPRLFAHYEGERLDDLKSPDAAKWR